MGTSIRAHQVPADDCDASEPMRQTRDEEVQEIAEEAYRGAQAAAHRPSRPARRDRRAAARATRSSSATRSSRDHGQPPRRLARRPRRRRGAHGRRSPEARRATGGGARHEDGQPALRPSRCLGAPPRARRRRRSIDSAPMFELIDHVGVAVDDLDAAVALYQGRLGDAARPPRDGHRVRVSRRYSWTSATGTSSCSAPLGPETPRWQVHRRRRPRPAPRCLPRRRHRRDARRARRERDRADRPRAAGRDPWQPRRLRAPPLHRPRAHRDRRTRGGH